MIVFTVLWIGISSDASIAERLERTRRHFHAVFRSSVVYNPISIRSPPHCSFPPFFFIDHPTATNSSYCRYVGFQHCSATLLKCRKYIHHEIDSHNWTLDRVQKLDPGSIQYSCNLDKFEVEWDGSLILLFVAIKSFTSTAYIMNRKLFSSVLERTISRFDCKLYQLAVRLFLGQTSSCSVMVPSSENLPSPKKNFCNGPISFPNGEF
jgi:hypothetical protein